MSFGLELVGDRARWVFETDAVHVHYGLGVTANPLLRRLRHVRVPYDALSEVRVAAQREGAELMLRLRPGADPLSELARDRLGARSEPYRLLVRAKHAELAGYHARLLSDRITLNPDAAAPTDRFLLAPPAPPRTVRCYDGKAAFDGATVTLRWAPSAAAKVKRAAGEQRLPVTEIADVEWLPSRGGPGHLRFRLRGGPEFAPLAADDPAALVLGHGYGLIADTLPFAAAVLAAARTAPADPADPQHPADARPAAGPDQAVPHPVGSSTVEEDSVELSEPAAPSRPAEPADTGETAREGGLPGTHPDPTVASAATIRQLYAQRESGLLGEREFQERKAEVLRRR